MSKVQLQHSVASRLTARIVETIADCCERIEVAGSVRRRAAIVGDIEVVAIPARLGGIFPGQGGASLLDVRLENLVVEGRLKLGRAQGEKYRQYAIPASPGLMLDLFIVTPQTWGVQLAIRTGPADFSRSLVTERQRGGRLDDGLVVGRGRVWRCDEVVRGMFDGANHRGPIFEPLPGAVPLDTPEERDFLAMAGG